MNEGPNLNKLMGVDEAFTEINEENYRNSTVEQIKAKLQENENKIKGLLKDYF